MNNPNYYCIITVRDGQNTISKAIESIVNQSLPPAKIFVINDGSSDNTGQILDKMKKLYPQLLEIKTTDSTTRDYSRIPRLWNVCLNKNYEYCLVSANDCIFESDYAKKILEKMINNDSLVICSGDYESFKNKNPRGAGRFIRQSFFFKYYNKYPEIVGYEAEILERALINGYKIDNIQEARFQHLDKLGYGHRFSEFGMAMRAMGYYPPYALLRCVKEFFRNSSVGKSGTIRVFWNYISYRPKKSGYYSKFPDEIRKVISNRQKQFLRLKIKMIIKNFLNH